MKVSYSLTITTNFKVEGVREYRDDLTRMEKWAEVWQMGFNVDKCKVMGLGH